MKFNITHNGMSLVGKQATITATVEERPNNKFIIVLVSKIEGYEDWELKMMDEDYPTTVARFKDMSKEFFEGMTATHEAGMQLMTERIIKSLSDKISEISEVEFTDVINIFSKQFKYQPEMFKFKEIEDLSNSQVVTLEQDLIVNKFVVYIKINNDNLFKFISRSVNPITKDLTVLSPQQIYQQDKEKYVQEYIANNLEYSILGVD